MTDLCTTADSYSVRYSGTLVDGSYHGTVDRSTGRYSAAAVQRMGGRITRLRLLTDPGCPFFDISYCHATLPDGRIVPVDLGEGQLPRRNTLGFLIGLAEREGYNAKRLGLLDRSNWAVLY